MLQRVERYDCVANRLIEHLFSLSGNQVEAPSGSTGVGCYFRIFETALECSLLFESVQSTVERSLGCEPFRCFDVADLASDRVAVELRLACSQEADARSEDRELYREKSA